MSIGFALSAPWGLFDTSSAKAGGTRRPLSLDGGAVAVDAGPPVIVAVSADAALRTVAKRRGIEPEGPPFGFGGARFRHFILDVGTRPTESSIELLDAAGKSHRLDYSGFLTWPGYAAGLSSHAPTGLRSRILDDFLFSCIERIRSAIDTDLDLTNWDKLDNAWSSAHLDPEDPPRELIVKHAQELIATVESVLAAPRRILTRTRHKVDVDRVQQIDVACIRWLIRQPGRNVYEQAGPSQSILAVVREEKFDTLENRVLRDFLRRSADVARSYCDRYQTKQTRQRWKDVRHYGQRCIQGEKLLREIGVGFPLDPIVPNYALLQNKDYNRVWSGYLALRRRLNDQDECWRWQHRLWGEFVRLATQVAIRRLAGRMIVAEAPFRIFDEQRRGQWTSLKGQSGTYLFASPPGGKSVVSVIGDIIAPHIRVPEWTVALCPTSVVFFDSLSNDESELVLVWAMHSCSTRSLDLQVAVDSANRAILTALNQQKLHNDSVPKISGVVIVSRPSIELGEKRMARSGGVLAITLGPEGNDLDVGLTTLAKFFGDANRPACAP